MQWNGARETLAVWRRTGPCPCSLTIWSKRSHTRPSRGVLGRPRRGSNLCEEATARASLRKNTTSRRSAALQVDSRLGSFLEKRRASSRLSRLGVRGHRCVLDELPVAVMGGSHGAVSAQEPTDRRPSTRSAPLARRSSSVELAQLDGCGSVCTMRCPATSQLSLRKRRLREAVDLPDLRQAQLAARIRELPKKRSNNASSRTEFKRRREFVRASDAGAKTGPRVRVQIEWQEHRCPSEERFARLLAEAELVCGEASRDLDWGLLARLARHAVPGPSQQLVLEAKQTVETCELHHRWRPRQEYNRMTELARKMEDGARYVRAKVGPIARLPRQRAYAALRKGCTWPPPAL